MGSYPSTGSSNGNATIWVDAPSTPPYQFTLNGVTNSTGYFDGLSGGNYPFTVTDAAGCTGSGTVTVGQIDYQPVTEACPRDTVITAGADCMAAIGWAEPSGLYPDTIYTSPGTGTGNAKLYLKGTYNGHGYYQSTHSYKWTRARIEARGLRGHLVTINDAAENNFIYTNFRQTNNYGPWIGLYNTGTPGSFAWDSYWDTDEPVNFTYWNPGEPNNQGGSATVIKEGYVHIMGYDYLNRWNDIGDIELPYIAEFDNPLITFRQIQGPEKGSQQAPGLYTIGYERHEITIGQKDTCYFNVTIVCNTAPSTSPRDTTIYIDRNTCMGNVTWTEPPQGFAEIITLPGGSPTGSQLRLKGVYNGHGYYLSDAAFNWNVAKSMSAAAGGHLVTITDAGENAFIYDNFRMVNTDGPWIGLYNTGTQGSFAWVTGEPVSYTNWNAGEPNNYKGSATNIYEPYVHIQGWDYRNRWNDMIDVPLRFIAEFETPRYTFRQTGGPANGSMLTPGVYRICYERIDWLTNEKENCCFNVTVSCDAAVNNRQRSEMQETGIKLIEAKAYPNPSQSSFSLQLVSGNTTDKVSILVVDVYGRIVEQRNGLASNTTVSIGASYKPGIYFANVMQGNRKLLVKLIKQ
jgi:hypothetical protein